ncbi:MAG: GGDEF domain-containing protein [Burkholderiaceae bacterium]|nr:GGDEF domain-containing protein [Burkholderiaceae bacterium]
MTTLEALFVVLALFQVILAISWGLSASLLGLSRAAGLHWAVSCLFVLLSMLLSLALPLGLLPPTLNVALTNTSTMIAFLSMRRGAHIFLRQPRRDLELAVVLALVVLIGLCDLTLGLDARVRGTLMSGLLCWTGLRLSFSSAEKVRSEFGLVAAGLVTGPMFAVALVFGLRSAYLAMGRVLESGAQLTAPTDLNVWLMLAFFVLSALLNLSLGYMVLLRLVRRLNHVSRHDALTGLLNRRAMQEALDAEFHRWQRKQESFALLLIDVDHFKRVNDQHGHAVGDQALCAVSNCLAGAVRKTDVLSRFGGEEFCVLLRLTDGPGAIELAQRLNQAVREQPMVAGTLSLPLTVSIGIAVAREGVLTRVEKLLLGADRALYRAKAEGRDRLAVASLAEMSDSGFSPMGA